MGLRAGNIGGTKQDVLRVGEHKGTTAPIVSAWVPSSARLYSNKKQRIKILTGGLVYRVIVYQFELSRPSDFLYPVLGKEVAHYELRLASSHGLVLDRILCSIRPLFVFTTLHCALTDLQAVGIVAEARKQQHVVSAPAPGDQSPLPPFIISLPYQWRADKISSTIEKINKRRIGRSLVPWQKVSFLPQLVPASTVLGRRHGESGQEARTHICKLVCNGFGHFANCLLLSIRQGPPCAVMILANWMDYVCVSKA